MTTYLNFTAPLIPGDANFSHIISNSIGSAPRITGLLDPIGPSDAVNKSYVDTHSSTPEGPVKSLQYNNNGTFDGSSDLTWTQSTKTLEVLGGKITGLIAPTESTDASNKFYIDQKSWKMAANAASTANIILSLAPFLSSVDGVSTLTGYRFLLKDQNDTTENGIYVYRDMNLHRADDASSTMIASGCAINIIGGNINKGKTYKCNSYSGAYVPLLFGQNIQFSEIVSKPAGVNNNIQYNDNGSFGSDPNLSWSSATSTMTVNGKITGLSYFPSDPSDATNKAYVDAQVGSSAGGTEGSIQFNKGGLFWGSTSIAWNENTNNLNIHGGINVSSGIYADAFYATSDTQFKSDISILNPIDSINILNKIECCSYRLKNSNDFSFGLLAQQLENIGLDNVVNSQNNYKAVNYIQIIPLLINSIQELNKRTRDLRNLERDFNNVERDLKDLKDLQRGLERNVERNVEKDMKPREPVMIKLNRKIKTDNPTTFNDNSTNTDNSTINIQKIQNIKIKFRT